MEHSQTDSQVQSLTYDSHTKETSDCKNLEDLTLFGKKKEKNILSLPSKHVSIISLAPENILIFIHIKQNTFLSD